jgi:NAD(P)-dependent dehydrogenase (short-subunit alcohol dehydrogenase family)
MGKSVLISGASSGIGKALSLELDLRGYRVFAGVRNAEDAQALHNLASPGVSPIKLDITDADMISTACREVGDKTDGTLDCLVNNAGINISGAMEFMPLMKFRKQLEVNLVGQLALTQACLPMLRKARGRVIFISSIAGKLVAPFNGPYSASKAALIAVADALRQELAPWKLPVTVMIVGSVQTPIWKKAATTAGMISRQLPQEAWELYGKRQKSAGASYKNVGMKGLPVEKVAKIIHHAIEKPNPKAYYLVGNDALVMELMVKLLPIRLRDWLVRKQMGLSGK